uniref:Cytochrome P450 6B7 n=1 Tax=Lygus hesperus TaxID=30085 RepID=A0A0A9X3U7_LYGHE
MDFLTYIILGLTALLVYFWMKLLNINRHWEKHGIPGPKPLPFFGNMLPILLGSKSAGEILKEIYQSYPNEKVVGYYHFIQPRLLIRDRAIMERILVKDYHSFSSRLGEADVENDPLNSNLFNMHSEVWRAFRSLMTPMFTPEKLKNMYPLMDSVGDDFIQLLKESKDPVDLLQNVNTFTIQVISSTALGIDAGPMDQKSNEFRERAINYAPTGVKTFLKFGAIFLAPKLAQKFGINFTSKETTNYFSDAFKTVVNHRKSGDVVRNDLVQQMITIQQNKSVEIGSTHVQITDDVVAGQALFLLFAGFVTSPLALTYMIYDLAANPEVQEKARDEVRRVTEAVDGKWKINNGKISYETLKDMRYLEGIIKESLRMSPTHPMIVRRCTRTYPIPEVSYTVSEGENIMVSALGIHHDSNYYSNPSQFSPERWTGDDRPPSSCYLAWGIGPKMCIGMRFASLEFKSVLAKLLLNFKISLHHSVKAQLKPAPFGIFTAPAHKILINFEKL